MKSRWSIGLFMGPEPERLVPMFSRPVLTAGMVTDVSARFVADPFLLLDQGQWCMFFEILPEGGGPGVIGLATSTDLATWRYEKVVLRAEIHLSYPHVFRAYGETFMVAETLGLGCVSLFRATAFPHEWHHEAALLQGQHADPTVFHHGGVWWMFTCPRPYKNDCLHLYLADKLTGPWRAHPANPLVVDDPSGARPAGPVLALGNRLLRFAQNCVPEYGTSIRCFEIRELTRQSYIDSEVTLPPVFRRADLGWNARGMHHIAMTPMPGGGYLACVDGRSAIELPNYGESQ